MLAFTVAAKSTDLMLIIVAEFVTKLIIQVWLLQLFKTGILVSKNELDQLCVLIKNSR